MEVPLTRLVVLASGSGSNLQAILAACADGRLRAEVAGVVSDQPDAYALERARAAGVPGTLLQRQPGEARADYDTRLTDVVAAAEPDWIVLAGWMRILTMKFLGAFPNRVVNLHPALPGELPGTHAIERAYEQFLRGERERTGVMIHLVPDEGVDDGPVLATADVPIHAGDTLDDLATRVHATEHELLVTTLIALVARSPHARPPSPQEQP
ncbi:phosphoribosylglycinamide formyltransferase [Desertimonas flava]|uniref:phosphoribosylglycinamide formyltransferase n=1 Tax=Desertimonas flava TaxID=2064846 RepID=UPI000E35603E|nr:phosphoribosylglycinamide formyltransferase [Desertimonas flava]